jgi:MFS family permease
MRPEQLLERGRSLIEDYPSTFRKLVVVTFIDHLGGALLFPFFALYITSKFNVGMTQVGVLFAAFSFSSFIGTTIGGALTDRIGRRSMLIFSLVSTSLSSVAMGLVESLEMFYVLALLVGIFTDTGGPARQAMVADLLPKEQHAQGFGIIRVAFNISATIGPAIGGFLASRSYLLLFIADAIISLISAVIVWRTLPETKPTLQQGEVQESVGGTFRGYFVVLRDSPFMIFLIASILMGLVYMNFGTTLGVYLRDVHGVPESGYGFILSLNAVMVVVLQFWVTRRIEGYSPMLMMAIGTFLYALGFAMYGFVSVYVLFLFAMVVITIGEMLVAPVSQAIVARFAPEEMRGRYMAVFGFSFGIPFAIGPLMAGLVLDNLDPRILWWSAGVVGLIAVFIFLQLHRRSMTQPEHGQVIDARSQTMRGNEP